MNTYSITIDGELFEVSVVSAENGKARVIVGDNEYEAAYELKTEDASETTRPGTAPLEAKPGSTLPGKSSRISCPIPGVVVSIKVKPGQFVNKGECVAVVEAMKMENEILSDCDGTVSEVMVKEGDSILEGAGIVLMESR